MGKHKRKFHPKGGEKVNQYTERDSNFNNRSESQETKLPIWKFPLEKLPSKGLSYNKKVSISYRPYAFSEIKKVSASKMTERQMYEFVTRGIFVEGMDIEDMTLGDANYLALYRKINALGREEQVKMVKTCDGCGSENNKVIKIEEINPKFIAAPDLPVNISLLGVRYGFGPMTIRKYFDLQAKLKEDESLDADFATFAMLCETHDFDDIYKALDNIYSNDDLEKIEKVDSYLDHGLKAYKMKCHNADKKGDDHCSHITEVKLDGGQAVLLPFRDDRKTSGDGISFGA